jgi:hypothetical protein
MHECSEVVPSQGQELSEVQRQLEAALAEGGEQRSREAELRAEVASLSVEKSMLQQQVNAGIACEVQVLTHRGQ